MPVWREGPNVSEMGTVNLGSSWAKTATKEADRIWSSIYWEKICGETRNAGNRGQAADSISPRAEYQIRLVHGMSFIDTSEKSSLEPIGSRLEFPGAGSHSSPEGWVRPQGVGPRALRHTYARTVEGLVAQQADSILIQSSTMLETK